MGRIGHNRFLCIADCPLYKPSQKKRRLNRFQTTFFFRDF
ncbi:hypothetical protein HMPREF1051_2225 [Neisseria sicca VK64]|uniref:Uncharacterized protein n=1 Tax=Neisseria sicca VK64 TaxID=1095748 RepID=I2NR41_NEISI|nr:hypothetical protein HMPREF1051_2225 [Neisseria sicca VK64]